ncbi:hypothetical protein ACO1O0_005319 [Amphichorda felina]
MCDSFSKSLERFRQRLSEDQRREFLLSNLKDIKRTIQQIQDKTGSEKGLRNLNRVKKFPEGIKQMEDLVKIFINVSEVTAIKIDTLELLLEIYQVIGEILYVVAKYDKLFQNHPDIREILETYFHNVLGFHYAVLKVMKRDRALLSDEKLSVVIEEAQESRDATQTQLHELSATLTKKLDEAKQVLRKEFLAQQESIMDQKSTILIKLDPSDYKRDQHMALMQLYSSFSSHPARSVIII